MTKKLTKYYKQYYFKNKVKISKKMKKYYKQNKKHTIKRVLQYAKIHSSQIAKYQKRYRIKNSENIKVKREKYFKEYRIRNRKKITIRNVNYSRKRRKNDINYKLTDNLRRRFNKAVERESKNTSIIKLLNCTISELKQYLQKQFTKGMTWENYGKWHIDHIKPCASFNLSKSKQQEKCFNYTNLQPLWAKDNLKKGDRCYDSITKTH